MNQSAAVTRGGAGEWLGHPGGLRTLFFTEMWERFSYYGMRALLVLFMVDQVENGGLGYSDQTATAVYGLYTAAAYLVALPGGWIADRLWGAQRAVWVGGISIMCGHFVLAIPGLASFYGGLLLVILGTGLLKPNISAIVGGLYPPGDPRRDSGFTIFYMGINVGGAIGPLICGWLAGENWHYGFAAAAFGMLAGLIQFKLTRSQLGTVGLTTESRPSERLRTTAWSIIAAVLAGALLLLWGGVDGWWRFDAVRLAGGTAVALVAATAAYFGYVFFAGKLSREERNRIVVIVVLVFAGAMFWAGFEQAGSTLNLFAERYTVRQFGGFEIPASWFQSLNPTFIILLAPLYSMLWVALARRHLEPSTPAKFALGLIILGLGFAVMIGAAALVSAGQQVLPTWLVMTYLLHTMGELALSPVGLSAMTKLAPRRFVGQMMGMWFMCTGLGYVIAGLMAGRFRADALEDMPGLYTQIVFTTAGCGLLLLLFVKPLKRLMGGVR
ncbi:MAG TPA: peptide MFS transporter [Gammaproteobacteria bacterium]|nr:peptide MFS transporter [Gammaproteobacteria bacterium]